MLLKGCLDFSSAPIVATGSISHFVAFAKVANPRVIFENSSFCCLVPCGKNPSVHCVFFIDQAVFIVETSSFFLSTAIAPKKSIYNLDQNPSNNSFFAKNATGFLIACGTKKGSSADI